MDLGLDPVHGVTHQAHALIGIETLDRLHQTHVALLDQIAVRQTVSQVLACDGHDQAKVRHDQLTGGFQVVVVTQAARGILLFIQREHGHAVDGRDVGVKIAQGRQRQRAAGPRAGHGQGGSGQNGGGKGCGHVQNPPQVVCQQY